MKRIIRNCETCGAPFPVKLSGRKIVCQFCGSIYIDDEFVEPKEDTAPSIPQTLNQYSPQFQDEKPDNKYFQTAKHNKIIPLVVVAVIVCILFLLFTIGKQSAPGGIIGEKIPAMLSILPTGEYAGKNIPFSDWELTISPEIMVQKSSIGIKLSVKNWGDSDQLFRYQPKSFTLYDDLGNSYPILFGNCSEDSVYFDKQISFKAFEFKTFSSAEYWCGDETALPVFFGTIPVNAKLLYLQMNDFGVFSKITFVFDL